jgi:hypothetical protein
MGAQPIFFLQAGQDERIEPGRIRNDGPRRGSDEPDPGGSRRPIPSRLGGRARLVAPGAFPRRLPGPWPTPRRWVPGAASHRGSCRPGDRGVGQSGRWYAPGGWELARAGRPGSRRRRDGGGWPRRWGSGRRSGRRRGPTNRGGQRTSASGRGRSPRSSPAGAGGPLQASIPRSFRYARSASRPWYCTASRPRARAGSTFRGRSSMKTACRRPHPAIPSAFR